MKEQAKRMERCRVHLDDDYPFYGYFLMRLDLISDPSCKTACTNGYYIKYNPHFTSVLNDKQLKTLLIHEIRHIIYKHHLRIGSRNRDQWNDACDYAINWEIVYEDRLEMIKGIWIPVWMQEVRK